MRTQLRSRVATLALASALVTLSACGDDGPAAFIDAAVPTCTADGLGCAMDTDCCTGTCDPTLLICVQLPGECLAAGAACQNGPDCCTFSCVDYKCATAQCTADLAPCTVDGECCGGTCGGGTCTPLNPTCKTSGNSCMADVDCCSTFCDNGTCSPSPSFCTQAGDACTNDYECCGGHCEKADGASLGLCELAPASGAGGCTSAGEVCGGRWDGGELPVCGGECCSRACFPFGPEGFLVCQPPSGCRPTGEICQEDSDCCGSEGLPDGETAGIICSKDPGNTIGRCNAGNSCTPAGGICRLQTIGCSANANCCAGNVLQFNTCAQDSLGIPRCLAAEIDCTDPSVYEGQACSTSADCCGLPCLPSGMEFPPLICNGMSCVPEGGVCTTSADCCAGLPCLLEPGASSGICGPIGECAEYGQNCMEAADCCAGLTCNSDGVCGVIIG